MNRREFSKTLLAGSFALPVIGSSFAAKQARAATSPLDLTIASRTLEVNGRAAKVYGLTGPNGKPGLVLNADETVDINVINSLAEETIVHWHGMLPAWPMDGVPDLPLPLLKAGERRAYTLPAGRSGTHWMHAHTLQEQSLLAAPLIVHSKEDAARDEQEVVVLLHDFSFTPASEILAMLKSGGTGTMGGMNMQGAGNSNMSGMNMGNMGGGSMAMDLNDIEYDAYLANDRTLDDPQVVQVEKGGTVRLRIINGATATGFTIATVGLVGEVIAVDGQDIDPLKAQKFPLSMGQRVDLRLRIPKHGGAYSILALREGDVQRTGIILATAGAKIEKLSPRGETKGPILSLALEKRLKPLSPLAVREPKRAYVVNLSGDMKAYAWSIQSEGGLEVSEGDRVEIEMRNASMMAHPMHLHGHHFQIVGIDGAKMKGAVRDTVLVPPMASVTFAFDAVNPGKAWAFHCHHLYHMAAGMMTTIAYKDAA